jgi:hypothetical protein
MHTSKRDILLLFLCISILSAGSLIFIPVNGSVQAAMQAASQVPPERSTLLPIRSHTLFLKRPAVAYNSLRDEYLVVWEEDYTYSSPTLTTTFSTIYGHRIDRHGSPIGNAFPIIHDPPQDASNPDVAYSSAQDKYLVVFGYNSASQPGPYQWDILGRIVNGDGSVNSALVWIPGTPHANDEMRPAITYNSQDDEFLVAYMQMAGSYFEVWVQRIVAADWSFPPGPVNVATGGSVHRSEPDVIYNESTGEYLIAYTYGPHEMGEGHIKGKFAVASLLGLSTGSEIDIIFNTNLQDSVRLAHSGEEYLAVWRDGPDPTERTIYARRLVNGTPPTLYTPFKIAGASGEIHSAPDVDHSSVYGYIAIWEYPSSTAGEEDIYGAMIKPGQQGLDGTAFVIDGDSEDQNNPALACSIQGDCLVAEEDYHSTTFTKAITAQIYVALLRTKKNWLPLIECGYPDT